MPEDLMEPLKESLIEFGAKRERARIWREQAAVINCLRLEADISSRAGQLDRIQTLCDRLEEATRDA